MFAALGPVTWLAGGGCRRGLAHGTAGETAPRPCVVYPYFLSGRLRLRSRPIVILSLRLPGPWRSCARPSPALPPQGNRKRYARSGWFAKAFGISAPFDGQDRRGRRDPRPSPARNGAGKTTLNLVAGALQLTFGNDPLSRRGHHRAADRDARPTAGPGAPSRSRTGSTTSAAREPDRWCRPASPAAEPLSPGSLPKQGCRRRRKAAKMRQRSADDTLRLPGADPAVAR